MNIINKLKVSRDKADNEFVVVVVALPCKEAKVEWAKWLKDNQNCKFSDDEIMIDTGRAKDGDRTYDFQRYSIKRLALKREGVIR